MSHIRYSGQVVPDIPSTAPMSLRLSDEVYALDGVGGGEYIVSPGARLEVGPHGKLYETMGGFSDNPVIRAVYSPTSRLVVSMAAAYHGYKRNNSIGWALLWGVLGGAAPPITGVIAVAQGFGKKKKGKR